MNSERTIRGNRLQFDDREHVLNAYIYRGTVENAKAHPDCVKRAGSRLPLITDEQWLAISEWPVTKAGRIDKRAKSCHTHHEEIPGHRDMIKTMLVQ